MEGMAWPSDHHHLSPFITMYHPTWDEDGSLRPIFDEICWQAKFRKQKPGLTDDRCCSVAVSLPNQMASI